MEGLPFCFEAARLVLRATAAFSFRKMRSNSSGKPGQVLPDFLQLPHEGRTSSHWGVLARRIHQPAAWRAGCGHESGDGWPKARKHDQNEEATYSNSTCLAGLTTTTRFPGIDHGRWLEMGGCSQGSPNGARPEEEAPHDGACLTRRGARYISESFLAWSGEERTRGTKACCLRKRTP